MQNLKEKIKYLFLHFLSPKEIIFLFCLVFLSLFLFIVFLYKSSSYFMADRIVYKGSLSEGIIGNLKNTNPFNSETQADKDISKLLFSSLIKNLSGDKFDLGLASKVDVTSDKSIYKITLRDNAFFSNGQKITLDDVLHSLQNIPLEKNYTVEKDGEQTLIFTIKKPNSTTNSKFLEALTFPIISKDEKFDAFLSTKLITSSFFKIQNVDKDTDGNVTKISLSRYNNGESKLPYIKNYTIYFYKNESDAYNAFQRKEIDLISGIPGSTISKIKDDTNIKFEVAQLPNNFAVFFNQNKNENLRDNDLRQALSDILDRTSLTNQVLGSFGIPEKNILGENTQALPAKEVLNNLPSSFSYENGVLYKSTKRPTQDKTDSEKTAVKIKITTIQNTELEETAKNIASSWAKIGVETSIQIIDRRDLNNIVKDRDYEGLLFGFSIKEASDYYSFFSSKERSYPKLNISNYTNKDADKILETLIDEKDDSRKKELITKLSREISKDNPIIILYKPQFVFAHYAARTIKLTNTIKSEEDRYLFINEWYTDTEKVLSIFNRFDFINKLDYLFN